jgi:hypothetical protein
MKKLVLLFIFVNSGIMMGQTEDKSPYYEIPDYPETYSANTVAARMVDGLGFRYYWATEGLHDEDLAFKPNETGRATSETIENIYSLSKFIRNSILSDNKDANMLELSFEAKRKETLMNFKVVADVLRNIETPLELENIEVPFWNIISGPIEDAVWHCGQVVLLRRSSGNPFNSKVSLFNGKVRD